MRTRGRALALAVALLGLLLACQARLLRHDQRAAAAGAEEFLRHAVVDRDFSAAYAMLRVEDKRQTSETGLTDAVKRQHPMGWPTRVSATEYEPVLGQAAIQIYLVGQNPTEHFYYRVPMVGTADSGYSPNGFFRGNQPYPPSDMRKSLK